MGNEQSIPASRGSPTEEEDDFDLDKIRGDDEHTPPPAPQTVRSQQGEAAQKPPVKKHGKKKVKAAELQVEIRNQPNETPSNPNKNRRAQKKSRGGRIAEPSANQQLEARRTLVTTKPSPEDLHIYASASSDNSDNDQPDREPLRKVVSPETVQDALQVGRMEALQGPTDEPHANSIESGAVENLGDSEEEELELKPMFEEPPILRKRSPLKKRKPSRTASILSEDHQVGLKGNEKDPIQRSDASEPSKGPRATNPPISGGEDSGEVLRELAADVPQAVLKGLGEEKGFPSENRTSLVDLEMQDVQIGSSNPNASSPGSVFDDMGSPTPANNFPASFPKSGLKRKQDSLNSHLITTRPTKKLGRDTFSPSSATSVESASEAADAKDPKRKNRMTGGTSNEKANTLALDKVSGLQPTLGSWAKALATNPSLRHPLFNPASPRKNRLTASAHSLTQLAKSAGPSKPRTEVVIPRRSGGEPSKPTEELYTNKSILVKSSASAKGKERAESDFQSYSPSKGVSPESDEPVDSGEDVEVGGFATTVARRASFSRRRNQRLNHHRARRDSNSSKSEDEDPDSDITNPEGSSSKEEEKDVESKSSDSDNGGKKYHCQICHRKFGKLYNLKLHMERPGIHKRLYRCSDCSKVFHSARALKSHGKRKLHGDIESSKGRKGHLSDNEIRRLNNWREEFCGYHDIDEAEFNDMMTATTKRSRASEWSWNFVTKREFLDQYFGVLPKRERRSMLRYRERNFKNLQGSKAWDEEDDDELERLVEELGTKWVEIGERMTRTADSVSQRWRHKLVNRSKRRDGIWLAGETELLRQAVAKVKGRLCVSQDETSDHRIAWSVVSNEISNIRTARQCSNHWDWLRMEHRFAKGLRKRKDESETASTGKRRKRLRAAVSEKYVGESDADAEAELREDSAVQQSVSSGDIRLDRNKANTFSNSQGTGGGTPRLPRNPLETHTPSKPMTLTQVFAQTQLNTSALRGTTRDTNSNTGAIVEVADSKEVPDRPSPSIPIMPRPVGDEEADQETMSSESQDEDEEDVEMKEDESGKAEESSSDEESAEEDEAGIDSASAASDDKKAEPKIGASQELGMNGDVKGEETSSEGSEMSSEETEVNDKETADVGVASDDELTTSNSNSGYGSGTELDSESGLEAESDPDSMVEDTKQDFMKNVLAVAKKPRNITMRSQVARRAESSSESD